VVNDVEESATRTQSISLDWNFGHLKNIGLLADGEHDVRILPQDTDVWLGNAYLCDPLGSEIIHYSDADYIARCADEADQLWGLGGIAMWQLGQEDARVWERLKGALLKEKIPIIQ